MSFLVTNALSTSSRCQRCSAIRTLRRTLAQQQHSRLTLHNTGRVSISTQSGKPDKPSSPSDPKQKSWLTRQVEASPLALKAFLGLAKALGYGSSKQLAGRRAFWMYKDICAAAPDVDSAFWKEACHLPPTFQSWFTVTNLHVWLLTVRLRALPQPHGHAYIQGLVDHFFLDVEERIRDVLQPKENAGEPYTFRSSFYINPNDPSPSSPSSPSSSETRTPDEDADATANAKTKRGKGGLRARAPDRLVTRQMKIFKEQWTGMGMALDLALVQGDAEMAAAAWRNLLGARGARGILLPETTSPSDKTAFRRAVNYVGGEVVNVAKVDVEKEETTDDGSGVHDFAPSESDKYIHYPETMQDIVSYIRRELVRLDAINDDELISGDGWRRMKFRAVKK